MVEFLRVKHHELHMPIPNQRLNAWLAHIHEVTRPLALRQAWSGKWSLFWGFSS